MRKSERDKSNFEVRKDLELLMGKAYKANKCKGLKKKKQRMRKNATDVDAVLGLITFLREVEDLQETNEKPNCSLHVRIAFLIKEAQSTDANN